ncbi:MAG: hypothetical protein ACRDL2_10035 [Gaiellaceae bacterium]
MGRIVFVGPHAALAAALHSGAAFAGAEPEGAVAEAIDELDVPPPPRVEAPASPDGVVDTGAWNLPEPVGLCLEELRELRAVIEARVAQLPG